MKKYTKTEIEHYLAVGILRDKFRLNFEPFVSIAPNSIPKAGSETMPADRLNEEKTFMAMKSIVLHRNGDITLKTDKGNIRFWRSYFERDYKQALKDGPKLMNRLAATHI